jgi:hypothetical protein
MNLSGTEIAGYNITFCVREHDGKPVQHLTITPVGFLDYGDSHWRADYVMIEIQLVILRSQIIVDEHMTVGSFVNLHTLLLGFQNGVVGSETFRTVDGHLDLKVEWRETTRDIWFAGRMPAFDLTELVDEPVRLRDAIYRTLSFQFALEPSALTRPIEQLKGLLELLHSLKSHPRGDAE